MSRTATRETAAPHGQDTGFRLVEFNDFHYAIPTEFVRVERGDVERAIRHPAVLAAPTPELLDSLIDNFDPTPFRSEPLGEFEGHQLFRHDGKVYGVPRRLGRLDLNLEADRARDGVVSGETRDEVAARIAANREAVPVEFLGWMPAFLGFGNCGTHPQFAHTQAPPPGYRFVRSAPEVLGDNGLARPGFFRRLGRKIGAVAISARVFLANCWNFGVLRCLSTLVLFFRLFVRMARRTGRALPALRFAHSRHFQSQVMAPRDAELVFLTSVPYTYGQTPWVIEIEDATTLFHPFVRNGATRNLDVRRSPYFEMVKALLEADSCRGIVTHMRSTAESLPTLFRSEAIARKVSYAPLGVRLPKRWQTHDDDETINLLFTNSWHQSPVGFYLRGGLDVLEALHVLTARYPQLRLTIRSNLPRLEERYHRILENGWSRVITRFTPPETLDEIQRESHIYLLPSARIHIVSVLQAMSYGQAVVVSDGWGMDEYITHEANGLVVKGRGGKVSWMDREAGLLREDYRTMFAPDPVVVEGLVEAVSRLVEEHSLRRRLGRAARKDVETKYTLPQWNLALKAAFDKARAAG